MNEFEHDAVDDDLEDTSEHGLEASTVGLVASIIASPYARFAPGGSVGPYRLVDGDQARWKAVDPKGAPVYLRIIPTRVSASEREAFLARAREVARLKHEALIPVRTVEKYGDISLVVSSGHPGRTLRSIVASGPMSTRDAAQFSVQLLHALSGLHRSRVVHGSLSPSVVHIEGAPMSVRLTSLSYENWLAGDDTLRSRAQSSYASPEERLLLGVDERSDVYVAGLLVFEAFTGVPMGHMLRSEDPSSAKSLFSRSVQPSALGLWDFIARATQMDPALRYSDATTALDALVEASRPGLELVAPRRAEVSAPLPATLTVSRALAASALAAIAVLLTCVILLLATRDPS